MNEDSVDRLLASIGDKGGVLRYLGFERAPAEDEQRIMKELASFDTLANIRLSAWDNAVVAVKPTQEGDSPLALVCHVQRDMFDINHVLEFREAAGCEAFAVLSHPKSTYSDDCIVIVYGMPGMLPI